MKKLLAILLAFAGVLSACTLESTEVNEIGLIYKGGTFEDAEFEGLMDPGTNNDKINYGGTVYTYYNDVRTYRVAFNPNEGDTSFADAIVVPTSETGSRAMMQGLLTFRLCIAPVGQTLEEDWSVEGAADNSPEKLYERCLVSFHENIGLKKSAFNNSGWTATLAEFLRPSLNSAGQVSGRQFTIGELILDAEKLEELNQAIRTSMPRFLRSNMGANYFYIQSVRFEEVQPEDPDVAAAFENIQTQQLERKAEEERGEVRDAQVDNIKKWLDAGFTPEQVVCLLQNETALENGVAPPVCLASINSGSGAADPVITVDADG